MCGVTPGRSIIDVLSTSRRRPLGAFAVMRRRQLRPQWLADLPASPIGSADGAMFVPPQNDDPLLDDLSQSVSWSPLGYSGYSPNQVADCNVEGVQAL